jgi:hypothetical protein
MLAVAHRADKLNPRIPNDQTVRHFQQLYVTGELSPGGTGFGSGFGLFGSWFGSFGSGLGFCCIVSSYSGCDVASTLLNSLVSCAFPFALFNGPTVNDRTVTRHIVQR